MSEIEPLRARAVSSQDLLARARALSGQTSAATPTRTDSVPVETSTSSAGGSEPLDYLHLRRELLTERNIDNAVSALAATFHSAFVDSEDVVGLDEQSLGVYLRWAITDVAWMLADALASDGEESLARSFLTVMNEPIPEDLGTWVYRSQPDIQKFVALAMNTYDGDAFEDLCSWLVGIMLGLGQAWPTEIDQLLTDLVDTLLDKLNGWAQEPWTLGVWKDWVNPYGKAPLTTPKKGRVITSGAVYLERSYRGFFFDLHSVANPDWN